MSFSYDSHSHASSNRLGRLAGLSTLAVSLSMLGVPSLAAAAPLQKPGIQQLQKSRATAQAKKIEQAPMPEVALSDTTRMAKATKNRCSTKTNVCQRDVQPTYRTYQPGEVQLAKQQCNTKVAVCHRLAQ